jgi:hypothetical protein
VRTFGVEIEFTGNGNQVVEALRAAGLDCGEGHYSARNRPGQWLVCPDSSVTGDGYGISRGGELKSPILNFSTPGDRELLARAVVAGRLAGMRPDDSCGIHVHIGSNGLEHENLLHIVRFFVRFEDAIYRIASSGWRNLRPRIGRYAPPLTDEQIAKVMKSRHLNEVSNIVDHFNGLHLDSHFHKGTIEFRMFNGSINPDRIWAYVALSHQIVRDTELGWKRNIGKAYRLGTMAGGKVKEETVRNYFFRVLGGNKERPGMSTADLRLLGKCWRDSVPQQSVLRSSW